MITSNPTSILIRSAHDADADALARLATLDAARVPAGPTLVAEVGGELVAAYGVARGERIGDPFRPTADVLDLLELSARRHAPRARAA
jgi:hypothetical protein